MKVQTRTTLEQKMMPTKNEQFRTIKQDHSSISGVSPVVPENFLFKGVLLVPLLFFVFACTVFTDDSSPSNNFYHNSGEGFVSLQQCTWHISMIYHQYLLKLHSSLLSWITVGNCRANQTAMDYCGEGNTCLGSVSSYVCVCEAPGWRLNPFNSKECIHSKYQ